MPAAPADHRRVVGDRVHDLLGVPDAARRLGVAADIFDVAAEADRIGDLPALALPRVSEREPVFRHLVLPAVPDLLLEQPVLVADAVAVGGNTERRQAVHETGGEPP